MSLVQSDTKDLAIYEPRQAIEFKRWMLYVREGDRGSIEALKRIVVIESDCMIKDVDTLTNKPQWLRGIPTLLDLKNKRKFEGSEVLQKLDAAISDEPLPYDNINSKFYSFGDEDGEWGGPARNTDFILPTLNVDARYSSDGKVSEQDIQMYERLRSGALQITDSS